MAITKVFKSGNSQAVRLPREFRFDTDEVEIFRRGDEIILRERPRTAAEILAVFESFSEDFMADGRDDRPPQEREAL
ncbi:MAG: type II toxin-antitoxin system VapB family antitoxin [Candidatus Competibacteraceae bacterium]